MAYVTRHIAYHRADLLTNIYPGNPAFAERYGAIAAGLAARGVSAADAPRQALAVIDGTVMRQAAMQAYNDAWMLLLVCFICVAPAVLLLRKPQARPAAPAAAADAH